MKILRNLLLFTLSLLPVKCDVLASLVPLFKYGHEQVWGAYIDNACPADVTNFPREALLLEAPQVKALPNNIAQARLSEAFQKKTIWGKLTEIVIPIAATVLSTVGIAKNKGWATYSGAATEVLNLMLQIFATPKDPANYFQDLLPDQVKLPPGAGHTYGILSATYDRNAKPIGPFIVARCK